MEIHKVDHPYCWAWCYLRNDFRMLDRALKDDRAAHEACFYDDALGRWVSYYELPSKEQARILDPALWNEIESLAWTDAPTRTDVGLGPRHLSPAILAALKRRRVSSGYLRRGTGRWGSGRLESRRFG